MTGWGEWLGAIWNNFVDGIESAGAYIINLLPDSPFQVLSNASVSGYMAWLNWLVPISEMVAILQVWTTAILSYYLYVTILRWLKAIQ